MTRHHDKYHWHFDCDLNHTDTPDCFFDASLSGSQKKQFKSGQLPRDIIIDCHGDTTAEAFDKTEHALNRAYSEQRRTVHIIHGKGTGRVKQAVLSCINAHHAQILAYCAAPARLGGEGCLMLLMRRQKNPS